MSIDYLKAIAVFLVITNHSLSKTQELKIGGPFWISMAVPIFMIISGYTNSMSADRREINNFKQYFDKTLIKSKISRLLTPFFVVFIIEILLVSIIPVEFQTKRTRQSLPILTLFLSGGVGPGSYYLPILIQLMFLFPIILFSFKKSPYKSITSFFLIHLCFDILSSTLPIPSKIYRLLIFRYISHIMLGVILYYYKSYLDTTDKRIITSFSATSIAYVFIANYTKHKPLIFSNWTKTSLPTIFLAFMIVIFGMKYLEIKNTNKFTNLISTIGKSSFHIFLVQKVFFAFKVKLFYAYLGINIVLNTIFSIFICCFLGISFYYLEDKFRKNRFTSKLDK